MATIVTPYNPWRENLAVNVLGGLLNNFLEQNRQAEQNRKVNAFRGQLQQDLQNNIIQEQGNSALSLAQPQAPAGYNASPWASMFHKTDSPLIPFDIGTSVIPMRDPTVQEISNTADTLGASQRFSMINPETIQGIKAGMIQQAEAQRIRGLQEDYARQFANDRDLASQMNTALSGVSQGVIPHQILTSLGNVYGEKIGADSRRDEATIKGITDRDVARIRANADIYHTDATSQAQREANYMNAQSNMLGRQATMDMQMKQAQLQYLTGVTASLEAQLNTLNEAMREAMDGKNPKEAAQIQASFQLQRQELLNQYEEVNQQIRGILFGNSPQVVPMTGSQESGVNSERFAGERNDLGEYGNIINKYAKEYDVDPDLIYAIMQVESHGRNGLTSSKGAQGLMQIMPFNFTDLGITDPFDPDQNIRGGTKYFRKMLDMFNGNIELAARAYNAGPGTVQAGRNPNPQYARDVLQYYNQRKKARGASSTSQSPNTAQSAQALGQQPQKATTGTPYFIYPNGKDFMTYEEFQDLAKRRGISEADLYQILENQAYTRDTRGSYDESLQPRYAPVNPVQTVNPQLLPDGLDYTPSYMRSDLISAPMVTPISKDVALASRDIMPTSALTAQAEQPQEQNIQVVPMSTARSVYGGMNRSGLNPYAEKNNWAKRYNPFSVLPFSVSQDSQSTYYVPHVTQNQQGISNFATSVPPTGVLGIDNYGNQQNVMDFPWGYYPDTGQTLAMTPEEYSSPLGLFWWNLPAVKQYRHNRR